MEKYCPPLCQRWEYRVLSASYGYIHDHKQKTWDKARTNHSWSRVRVYFPESQYHLHSGKIENEPYMAMVEIAGVIGVYLGFSIITVGQLLIYSFYVLWVKATDRS